MNVLICNFTKENKFNKSNLGISNKRMKSIKPENKDTFTQLYRKIYFFLRETMSIEDVTRLSSIVRQDNAAFKSDKSQNSLLSALKTAVIAMEEIGLKQPTVCSILLFDAVQSNFISFENIEKLF